MRSRGIILIAVIVITAFLIILNQKEKLVVPHDHHAIVGLESPEFTLLGKDGLKITLSQLKGKTVFTHFWASWCKECREELPAIQDLYNRKKSDPEYVFLSVVFRENPEITERYMIENNLDFPLYIDPEYKAAKTYGLTGVPETFIIDPDGILQKRILGPAKWEEL